MEHTNYNSVSIVDNEDTNTTNNTGNVNNQVTIEGRILDEIELHHTTHGEKIYLFTISSSRLNNETTDDIPVEVSERVVDINEFSKGDFIRVLGQFRSYNQYDEESGRVRLRLFIFARDMEKCEEGESKKNNIHLMGYICKKPVFRTTPQGREISDVILAVNRMYKKTDYIPCIAWSRNARFLSRLEVGTKIDLDGRLQSRTYRKRITDEEYDTRTVYEVSVSSVQVVDKDAEEEKEESFHSETENS